MKQLLLFVCMFVITTLQAAITQPPVKAPYVRAQSVHVYDSYTDTTNQHAAILSGNLIAVTAWKRDFDSTITMDNYKQVKLWMNGKLVKNAFPVYFNEVLHSFIFNVNDSLEHIILKVMAQSLPDSLKTDPGKLNIQLGNATEKFPNAHKMPKDSPVAPSFPGWVRWIIYGAYLITLILILTVGRGLLRDVGIFRLPGITILFGRNAKTTAATGQIAIKDIPYSMARTQLFLWIILISGTMVHIWSVTGKFVFPNDTIMLLLSISGGTYVVGKIIDNQYNLAAGTVPQFISEHDSEGFLKDLLSDQNSINLHRLQFLIFTVILAVYFIVTVIYELKFPDLDTKNLLLIGISSGMYAGIKTQEGI